MNENIDLTKILKDCPKGWKLYSPLCGEVEFSAIKESDIYPIIVRSHTISINFSKEGYYFLGVEGAECLIFPSKDQRDWNKFNTSWYKKERFDPRTLKPYEKVLVKDYLDDMWKVDLYSHEDVSKIYPYRCVGNPYKYCIPYNDSTKHFVGTIDEVPEYYRYWEDKAKQVQLTEYQQIDEKD